MTQKRQRGFTLIELLAVILIIGVLAGLLLPVLYDTKKQSKRRQARAEIKALESAVRAYHFELREWPCGDNGEEDTPYENDNGDVVTRLIDATPPFLKKGDFNISSLGKVVDPWGTPYKIHLDTDYDGEPSDGVVVTSSNL